MESDRATVELDGGGKRGGRPPRRPADDDRVLEGGAHIGRYVILHRQGSGGMGHVYAAFDPELDRKVAIKLLRPRYADKRKKKTSSAAHTRMMREAQALARLSHPNVVAIHDVGMHEERLFLAMDFAEGKTLDRWAGARRRTWQETIKVYVQAGRGLAGAHAAGLVHRDFKPQNVIVGGDGRVRVLDFGLAQSKGSTESSVSGEPVSPAMSRAIAGPLTLDGAVIGTPAYMAPEQHLSEETDARSDQFAFCLCLYEALYRRPAFAGERNELSDNVTRGNLIEPPANVKVPARIRKALMRGLSREPQQRHPSMDALLRELQPRSWSARQQVIFGVGGAVVIGAAAYVGAQAGADPDSHCEDSLEQLAGIWDEPRKTKIAAAFAATDKPYAKTVWHTTASIVDAHAEQWAVAHTAACEATWDRQQQSEREGYLRMACLQRRLEELSALAALFEQADSTIVERAVQAANGLGSVSSCEDAKALSAHAPTPDNAEDRVAIAALRTQLVQATAQADAGKYEAGMLLAEAAVAQARKTNFRPIEAEALVVVGQLKMRMGDPEGAENRLRDAVVAAEAGGHTEAEARAWIELLDVAQLKPDLLPSTKHWERHADALLEHLGGSPTIEARLLYNVGNLRGTQGRVEEAVDAHFKALAIRERIYGGTTVDVGISLRGVGYALQGAGRYDESLVHFRRSQEVLEELLGTEHPEVASTLTGIAISRDELGERKASRSLYDRAARIFERAHGPNHPKVATALNNVAGVLYGEGDYRGALTKFQRALAIWERAYGPEHQDVALTLGNVGLALDGLQRYEEALDHHQRALATLEAVFGPDHPDLADPLGNLGDLYVFLGRHEEALRVHRRAAELLRVSLGRKHPRFARALIGVGYDHELLGEVDVALDDYDIAQEALREALGTEHPDYADAVGRIGLARLKKGEVAEAKIRLEQALSVLDASNADEDTYGQAEVAFGLARAIAASEPSSTVARELAERARKVFADDKETAKELAELDAWLAKRPSQQ